MHLQCTLRIRASGHLLSVKLVTTYDLPSIRSSTFCTLGHLISPLRNWWKAPLFFHFTVSCPWMWDLKLGVCNPGLGHGQMKGFFCRGANQYSLWVLKGEPEFFRRTNMREGEYVEITACIKARRQQRLRFLKNHQWSRDSRVLGIVEQLARVLTLPCFFSLPIKQGLPSQPPHHSVVSWAHHFFWA